MSEFENLMRRLLGAFVVVLGWSSLAAAQEPAPSAGTQLTSVRSVEVIASGDPTTTMELHRGILVLLSDRGVQLNWSSVEAIAPEQVLAHGAAADGVVARVWLDARASDRALLYVVNTSSDRFLVRVVPLESGYDEVARESLGHIVESAMDALLAGAEIGVPRELAQVHIEREIGLTPEAQPQVALRPTPALRRQSL